MKLGQKLKQLRSSKGLTQKDLAEQLNVSFQTVSKWENNENEPDLETVKQLAKVFGCSIDYLLSDSDEEPRVENVMEAPTPVVPQPQTIVIHQRELHVCERCKKDIPENELEMEQVPHVHRHGRTSTTTYSQAYYHRACFAETQKERAALEQKLKENKISAAKKKSFGWGISMGAIMLTVALVSMLVAGPEVVHPALAVLYSAILGYVVFAELYCILSGSFIGDVFLSVASWSIRFPGVIFTFDLGGFIWLIAIKLLFVVLGFLFGVFVLFLAIAISSALAAVCFPFILTHNVRTGYADAL